LQFLWKYDSYFFLCPDITHSNYGMIISSQACLIADIVQHFIDAKLEFDPSYIYEDVNQSIQHVHRSGLIHRQILSEPEKFLIKKVGGTVAHFYWFFNLKF
jgi:hypothetical protein